MDTKHHTDAHKRGESRQAIKFINAVSGGSIAPGCAGGVHPIQIEQITWCTAEHKPDADTTVMLSLEGLSEPTSVGYWNGDDWIDCTGMPVTPFVTSWAHMPAGFFPALKGKHSRRT